MNIRGIIRKPAGKRKREVGTRSTSPGNAMRRGGAHPFGPAAPPFHRRPSGDPTEPTDPLDQREGPPSPGAARNR